MRKKRTGLDAQGTEVRKRNHIVGLRLNDSEVKKLQNLTEKVGGSRQSALRKLIFEAENRKK